ncbi:MAG: hypothetical protein QG571_1299, partial [Pseudomonadota bacterium]|nr:hypothetical protein [Pseudomonadota bacterium]
RDVEKLPGGSHFRIVKSVDRKQERPALVVSEAMAIQAAAIVRLLDNDDADMRDVATRARLFVGAIARAVLAAAGKERG